jgi:hypothetical protein
VWNVVLALSAASGSIDAGLRACFPPSLGACRCQELSNGAMIPGVEDFAQARGSSAAQHGTGFEGKRLLTPDQLRQSLKSVLGIWGWGGGGGGVPH